jgi:hypothetical protein
MPSVRKPFSSGLHSTWSLGRSRHSSKSRRNRPEYKPRIEGTIAERKSICAKTVKVVIRARRCRTAFCAEHKQHQQHWGPSRVYGTRLRDCRRIGGGDPCLQVLPDSIRCFVVAPFDVLALRFGECRLAASGGGWPGHPVSLAYYFRLEQLRVCREKISRGICWNLGSSRAGLLGRPGSAVDTLRRRAERRQRRRRGGPSSRPD